MDSVAERAEAILDKIAQRRLNPCPFETTGDDIATEKDAELVEPN